MGLIKAPIHSIYTILNKLQEALQKE